MSNDFNYLEEIEKKFIEFTDDKMLSPWGNSFVDLTIDDINMLIEGKKLIHSDGEYCTVIQLKENQTNNYAYNFIMNRFLKKL